MFKDIRVRGLGVGGVLPYMSYIDMRGGEGYGFQAVRTLEQVI